jgi:RNA polymerase sigma factor (sigma-70 family)
LRSADRDEAYTAAVEALERAVASYDPARGARLVTFVYATVERTLKSFKPGGPIHVPKHAVYKQEARAARRTYGLWQVGENVALPLEGELDQVERREIAAAIGRLQPRDEAVVIAIVVERRSLNETAKHLGLSRSEVRVSWERSLRVLRGLLADYRPDEKPKNSGRESEE